MTQKNYAKITGIIFFLIALLHLLRIVFGGTAILGGWTVPLSASWVAFIVSGYLAYEGLRLHR